MGQGGFPSRERERLLDFPREQLPLLFSAGSYTSQAEATLWAVRHLQVILSPLRQGPSASLAGEGSNVNLSLGQRPSFSVQLGLRVGTKSLCKWTSGSGLEILK